MNLEIKSIDGIQDVQREIQKLADDKMKRREIIKILRRQAKPLLKAIKSNTPIAEKEIQVRDKKYAPQNLKKSMAIKTSPMKTYPNVLVGPRQGANKKYDGFYAFFLQYGTTKMPKNDFIGKAFDTVGGAVENQISNELERYVDKKAQQLNL